MPYQILLFVILDPNAICANGKCVCKPFFEFFQYRCIPVKGCLYDGHCMFKNTVCKGQRCECREGHVRNTTIGPCIQSQRYGSPTSTTTSPTSTSTSTDSGVVNKTALEEEELQSKQIVIQNKPELPSFEKPFQKNNE